MARVRAVFTLDGIAQRLRVIRLLQCALTFIIFVTSVYLAAYIGSHKLGLQGGLPVAAIMSGVSFILTGFGHWLGHDLGGNEKRRCLCLFIHFDLMCIGTQAAAIAVLAVAGLPWKCSGLTRTDYREGDAPFEGDPEFSTNRFGDGSNRGMLDRYCGLPRSSFWMFIILMISYFYAIGLSIRLMVALSRKAKALKAMRDQEQQRQPQEPPVISPRYHVAVPVPAVQREEHRDFGSAASTSQEELTVRSVSPEGSPPPYRDGVMGSKIVFAKGRKS